MRMIDPMIMEFDRECASTRKMLANVPGDKLSWKPHEKSMAFGPLCDMVATIPSWMAMILQRDSLDVAPKDKPSFTPPRSTTSEEYLQALDAAAAEARNALRATDDAHLETPWQLMAGGQVVSESPRRQMLRDTINHWAHHRGQMTVYLRLLGQKVPSIYGPSADDRTFG